MHIYDYMIVIMILKEPVKAICLTQQTKPGWDILYWSIKISIPSSNAQLQLPADADPKRQQEWLWWLIGSCDPWGES